MPRKKHPSKTASRIRQIRDEVKILIFEDTRRAAQLLDERSLECYEEGHKEPSALSNKCHYCYQTLIPSRESLDQAKLGIRIYNDMIYGIPRIIKEFEKERREADKR